MPSPSRIRPRRICSVPTKSWRNRPASSLARMLTRRALSVNLSNTWSPRYLGLKASPVAPSRPEQSIPASPRGPYRFLRLSRRAQDLCPMPATAKPFPRTSSSGPGDGAPLEEAIAPVGLAGQIVIVGSDDEGQVPLRLEPQEEIPDDLARLGIEIARGLVGEHHRS